jgi:hypothetical protein
LFAIFLSGNKFDRQVFCLQENVYGQKRKNTQLFWQFPFPTGIGVSVSARYLPLTSLIIL